jgi:hypothetical protein
MKNSLRRWWWPAFLVATYLLFTALFWHAPVVLPCHCGCKAPTRILCNSPVCRCNCPPKTP